MIADRMIAVQLVRLIQGQMAQAATIRVSFSQPHYNKLGCMFEVHDISGIERAEAAWAFLTRFHMNVLRVVFDRGVDGVGANRAINLTDARGDCFRSCHRAVLLHTTSTRFPAKMYQVFSGLVPCKFHVKDSIYFPRTGIAIYWDGQIPG